MKKIPYGRQTILEEDIEAVVKVLRSDFLTQGPEVTAFEQMVAEYHGARYAVAFSNGTAALHAAYHALGVVEGDEIITSPMTFAATANGAVYCGARPVFADIDAATNCICIEQISGLVNEKTKVISPIAFAGYPVDLKAIREIADEKGCSVLYDAAHAIGSKRDGTFGMEYVDAAIFSFHPVKHIAAGEGGMVVTNREDVYKKLLLFRTHGITKDPQLLEKSDGGWYYEMQSLGYNFRITEMQCALAISQFRRLEDNLRRRNQIASIYEEELKNTDSIGLPPSVGYQILTEDSASVRDLHAYHLYTITAQNGEKRKQLYEYLHENGIMAQVHYVPVHLHPFYRDRFGYSAGDCPVAEDFYARELSIPMYHGMSEEDQEYIIDVLKKF